MKTHSTTPLSDTICHFMTFSGGKLSFIVTARILDTCFSEVNILWHVHCINEYAFPELFRD